MSDRPIPISAILRGSGIAFGEKTIPSGQIDAAFGMPAGKLQHRAGILSVARAGEGQKEVTLGAAAAREALAAEGSAAVQELDWILAASETHNEYPALAAQIHLAIGAPEECGALDLGGACLGFVHALAVAKAFVQSGQGRNVLVVTADVHSRILTPERVAGEFGGLFGDGAAAFLVQRNDPARGGENKNDFELRELFFGCATQFQAAIQVSATPRDQLKVVFDGDALSRAATARLTDCIAELEKRSGIARGDVAAFATHQPNPRLVALLAKKAGLAAEKFPLVADVRGNLGSTTCAAALHLALQSVGGSDVAGERKAIFVASLGPGLLFGGGWLKQLE